jgi:ParB family transcriptional regulator, chromosome partitioning protein
MALRIKPISLLPDLAQLDAGGQPKLLPVDAIDEDPEQPRREFDAESLGELAETIKARGVRSPVSVRPHPREPGRWMLNFGARRLRASKLAGRADIRAFVDEAFDSYDQVIENEQREGLKPLEIALFIKRQLDHGHSRIDIARGIGKSPSYVTLASALIDAPDWLMDTYRAGKCRGMLELCELRRLHEQDRVAVESWLAGVESVGRAELRRLRQKIAGDVKLASELSDPSGTGQRSRIVPAGETQSPADPAAMPGAPLPRTVDAKAIEAKKFEPFKPSDSLAGALGPVRSESIFVEALHDGRKVRVILDEVPITTGTVYVVSETGGRVVTSVQSLGRIELVRGAALRS